VNHVTPSHHATASRPSFRARVDKRKSGPEITRQGTAAPESISLLIQLNTRTTNLLTISKGNFSHEDLGS
jgi:hypothetical protein